MQFIKEQSTCIDKEIERLLDFIRQWEKEHPNEELVFITLPKYDQKERERILRAAVGIIGQEDFSKAKDESDCMQGR